MPSHRTARIVVLAVTVGVLLTGCETYPSPEDVVACAEQRLGHNKRGSFRIVSDLDAPITQRVSIITYIKDDGSDQLVVRYTSANGMVSDIPMRSENRQEGAEITTVLKFCELQPVASAP